MASSSSEATGPPAATTATAAASSSSVCVTGGAGYIGSHTVLEFLEKGSDVTILDNLINASERVLDRLAELAPPEAKERLHFHKVDLLDEEAIRKVFAAAKDAGRPFTSVIHFAGLKAVGESIRQPIDYYHNNITGTLNLVRVCREFSCFRLVFSSSATVYGTAPAPFTEESSVGQGITNPYGWTKYMLEQILSDLSHSDSRWSVVILRYFNPCGAHPSGRLGENPRGVPNNLLPFVQQVATGRREKVIVFGNDYPTPDGSAQRDFIHVVDLAKGHVAALAWLDRNKDSRHVVFNLGTGTACSVLDVIREFSTAAGKSIPWEFGERRPGDLAIVYAAPDKAERELQWCARRTLQDMCADSWRWASANPYGYEDAPSQTS